MQNIEIREVKTKKEQKEFLNFPLKLYKGNPYFVPPLYADEKKIFNKNYFYYKTCDAVYYNAYMDGRQVGRISGILQKVSNEKRNEKRVRFTRFDSINDVNVAKALFSAVEDWGRSLGMDTVCGPLGFSDLEREGLLIEGFDKLSTFEEQYNFEYYGELIEKCGYGKEIDWLESRLNLPDERDEKIYKMAEFVMKRYDLHYATAKNTKEFLNKYSDKMFALLDTAYIDIYGSVPFDEDMKKEIMANFNLVLSLDYVRCLLDKDENPVCFGLAIPSIAKAVQKSNGHLTLPTIVRALRSIKKPDVIELALVGVAPEYLNRGITAVVTADLMDMLSNPRIKYAETNLNLENNYAILNLWKRFKAVRVKRRRAYTKSI